MNDLNRQVAELLGRKTIGVMWPTQECAEKGIDPQGGFGTLISGATGHGWTKWVSNSYDHSVHEQWQPDTDANQIDAAVREWCGRDKFRWEIFGRHAIGQARNRSTEVVISFASLGLHLTAPTEQKCRALIAAAKELANEA